MSPRHNEQDVIDRFEELDESGSTPPSSLEPSRTKVIALTGAGVIAVVIAAVLVSLQAPLLAALVAFAGGVGVSTLLLRRPKTPPPVVVPRRSIELRDRALYFEDAARVQRTLVVKLDGPFGITLLANRARTRASLIITAPDGSFFVGAVLGDQDHDLRHRILAHASLVASDEGALDPGAPDGLPFAVSGETFARLYQRLVDIEPLASERLFTSDARGNQVIVDGRVMSIGKQVFDLASPLEWRSLLFREMFFGGLSVFQATQVRQAENEVVFVSMLPALSVPSAQGDSPADPDFERFVARDIRLLNAVLEDPPSAALRVAIDRVFMLPLRAALDRAPVRVSAIPGDLAGAPPSTRRGQRPRSSAS